MLRIEQVCKLFNAGTADEKFALQHVNLELNEGDFVTIIGSNGAGKSTLMNVISGVMIPDIGSIHIKGKEVTSLSEHVRSKWIGRVFQDPMAGTAPSMTIEENLALAFARGGRRRLRPGLGKRRREWFRTQLYELGLGLEERLTAKVGLLSGGERQALSLLMATFMKPNLLLLDEHTAALDPARAEMVTRLTEKIVRESGLTTLMVTHNMEQAIRLGNRLIMMDKGRIILNIGPEEKRTLTVEKLLREFELLRGEKFVDDRVVLGS